MTHKNRYKHRLLKNEVLRTLRNHVPITMIEMQFLRGSKVVGILRFRSEYKIAATYFISPN